jgi:hypothetical protein
MGKPRSRVSGESRGSARNTHNQSSHGGKRKGAGAPLGNDSAKKRLPWLSEYDLDTFQGVDAFTKELLKATWSGRLGSRQSNDCLGILRLLLERRFWLPSGADKWNPETHRFNTPTPESFISNEKKFARFAKLTEKPQDQRTSDENKELEALTKWWNALQQEAFGCGKQ